MRPMIWAAAFLATAGDATAQPYVGSEPGPALAPALRLECDTPPPPTEWTNESGRSAGIATGIAAGYRFGRYRAEVEYRYHAASYHDYAPTQIGDVVTAQKADQELETAIGGAGDVAVHGVFTNLAVDLRTANLRITSYVGAGAGVQRMSIDYFSLWKRNNDPARIATFEDATLRARLAGTTTIGTAVLDDTMFSVQILAGVDYRVAEGLTIGQKIRYAPGLGTFRSLPREWDRDQLRSHESSVGRGSAILYTVETHDTSALTMTLSLRYAL